MEEHQPFDALKEIPDADVDQDKLRRELEIDDLRWLMSTPRGRRIKWRSLSRAGIFRSTFAVDPLMMAFREGERNLGIMEIAQLSEHCPSEYIKMLKEQQENPNG